MGTPPASNLEPTTSNRPLTGRFSPISPPADHGRARARLIALQRERPVDRLIAAGLATPPSRPKGKIDWAPVAGSGPVSDLIER